MKDSNGNDLVKGWYWITDPREGDIWYPIVIDGESFMIDGETMRTETLSDLSLVKAEMPVFP